MQLNAIFRPLRQLPLNPPLSFQHGALSVHSFVIYERHTTFNSFDLICMTFGPEETIATMRDGIISFLLLCCSWDSKIAQIVLKFLRQFNFFLDIFFLTKIFIESYCAIFPFVESLISSHIVTEMTLSKRY